MSRLTWTKEMESQLVSLRADDVIWTDIPNAMNKVFGLTFTTESCRNKYRALKRDNKLPIPSKKRNKPYKEELKIQSDGSQTSDKLIDLSEKEMKDTTKILDAHGYDPNEWELTSSQSSMWHHHNKQDGTKILYASKIKVRPKQLKLTDKRLIQVLKSKTKPIDLSTVKYKTKEKWLLEIPLMDMHFGINTIDDYKQSLLEIIDTLNKRVWEEVIITFGSDLLHVDNLKNTTANQTRIQDVDHVQMIEDAKSFYEKLVRIASRQSNHVKVYYIKGNHDETTSGLLIHWLHGRFAEVANVTVDYSIEEVKVHSFEKIFIGLSHGDKGGKRRKNILATKYPVEWAKAKVRELHTGHLHHEKALDEFGILERTLPTKAKTDQYHKDNSYEGAHQRFMLFEYSEDRLRHIHYV